MARVKRFTRTLTVLGAAVLALSLATAAFAQAPPSPPHQFYGSAGDGTGATLDGVAAADGAVVIALDDAGVNVAEGTVADGVWLGQVDPADAASVTFTVDGIAVDGSHDVVSGSLSAVTLAATSPVVEEEVVEEVVEEEAAEEEVVEEVVEEEAADEEAEAPAALPNTGIGGLADGGSGLPVLPLVLALTVVLALGGVAATRRSLS